MESTTILVGIILVLIGILYTKSVLYLSYWKRKGVSTPIKPWPIVGNMLQVLCVRKSLPYLCFEWYGQTKPLPFFGIYGQEGPALVVKDLDLIKTILTKDFIHFTDHNMKFNEEKSPMLMNLFSLTGEAWKKMRVKLTPTFTTSKMKYMFKTVAECNIEMFNYMDKTLHTRNNIMDVKELFATLNTDVIGSCAFGIECNSFNEPDSKFREFGRNLFKITPTRLMLLILMMCLPKSWRKDLVSSNKRTVEFFYNLVEKTIKHREDNNIVRNDFMQLLINLKRDGRVDKDDKTAEMDDGTRLTIMQITAQVFVFFIAGFETSSTTASFALYELALNPNIQEKLRDEIDQVLGDENGNISYDNLAKMTYLDIVIEETLRKYPPAHSLMRICTKEYAIPHTNITIEKGTQVLISTMGIHRDPDIYPDPMKFDPERFTAENKAMRHNNAYMPFGDGPRLCIGSRFGLMQTKLGLVSILSKYKVSPCEATHIPMKYNKTSPVLSPQKGLWLKVTLRNSK